MKVLHINSTQSWRGGEQQLASLVEELAAHGIRQTIACRTNSSLARVAGERGWNHRTLPFRNAIDLFTVLGLRRLCRTGSFDLIHIHTGRGHDLAVLSSLAGCSTPMVLSRRVIFPVSTSRISRWKYDLPQIRRILCASDAVAEHVRRVISDPGRVSTVYDGVEPSRFRSGGEWLRATYDIPPTSPLIGKVAALTGEKDHETFVETARMMLAQLPNARFFVIGDGPEEERIDLLIRRSGLASRVFMTGFLANIEEVLPELDLLMMTSRAEGLGSSILDAFASRVPVVATAAGGIPEIVIDRRTGLLAPVGEASALAAKGIEVLKDRDLAESLVEEAYRLLLRRHTASTMANETLRQYRLAAETTISP